MGLEFKGFRVLTLRILHKSSVFMVFGIRVRVLGV